jgi:hypothetical protein
VHSDIKNRSNKSQKKKKTNKPAATMNIPRVLEYSIIYLIQTCTLNSLILNIKSNTITMPSTNYSKNYNSSFIL